MPFEHHIVVRFKDVDRAGIAFFGCAFDYSHAAFEELLAAALPDLNEAFGALGWGMPVVHAEADYTEPCRLGERLSVRAEVARLGERSISFRYSIFGPDGSLRVVVRMVHAFIAMPGFGPVDAPQSLLSGLRRLGVWREEG